MLVRLSAKFMSGSMITFVVGDRGGSVGVGGKVVELGGSIVRALRHTVLLPNCSHRKTGRASEISGGTCACGCEMLVYR
jgi:hypothetical protein